MRGIPKQELYTDEPMSHVFRFQPIAAQPLRAKYNTTIFYLVVRENVPYDSA
jgi:hypothetical protein